MNVFKSSPVSMIIFSLKNKTYLDVNDNFILSTGFTREEIIGRKASELGMWFSRQDYKKLEKIIFGKKDADNREIRFVTKQNEVHYGLLSTEKLIYEGEECVLAIINRITEIKRSEEKMRFIAEQLSKVFDAIPMQVLLSTVGENKIVMVNRSFSVNTGFKPEEVIGRSITDLNLIVDMEGFHKTEMLIEKDEPASNMLINFKNKSGDIMTGLLSGQILEIGGVKCFLAIITDITKLKKTEEKMRQTANMFTRVFEASPLNMAISKLKSGEIIDVNGSFVENMGFKREEVIGRTMRELDIWFNVDEVDNINQLIKQRKPLKNLEINYKNKSGEIRIGLLSGEIIDIDGVRCLITLLNDITERKKAEEFLHNISYMDGLTSIANRRRFDEMIEYEWRRGLRSRKPLSLIMIDIDYFKAYNDSYGHLKGDECLKKIAATINGAARRTGDLAARYGGEEFIIILPETEAEGALSIAQSLRAEVENMKIRHNKSPICNHITISLGVATVVPNHNFSPLALTRQVDRALYAAKRSGGNRVKQYPFN